MLWAVKGKIDSFIIRAQDVGRQDVTGHKRLLWPATAHPVAQSKDMLYARSDEQDITTAAAAAAVAAAAVWKRPQVRAHVAGQLIL